MPHLLIKYFTLVSTTSVKHSLLPGPVLPLVFQALHWFLYFSLSGFCFLLFVISLCWLHFFGLWFVPTCLPSRVLRDGSWFIHLLFTVYKSINAPWLSGNALWTNCVTCSHQCYIGTVCCRAAAPGYPEPDHKHCASHRTLKIATELLLFPCWQTAFGFTHLAPTVMTKRSMM